MHSAQSQMIVVTPNLIGGHHGVNAKQAKNTEYITCQADYHISRSSGQNYDYLLYNPGLGNLEATDSRKSHLLVFEHYLERGRFENWRSRLKIRERSNQSLFIPPDDEIFVL